MHPNITCDTCNQHGILGSRWKCNHCFNFDMCYSCYVADKHDMSHQFVRFDTQNTEGVMVNRSRESAGNNTTQREPQVLSNRATHAIICDKCNQYPFVGTRWKCAECLDFDLCDDCYRDNECHPSHLFIRIDSADSGGTLVKKRSEIPIGSNVPRGGDGGHRNQNEIKHPGITCDTCNQHGIIGSRWKCNQCCNFDLCYNCYVSDKHDTSHQFTRFEVQNSKGIMVSRSSDSSVHNTSLGEVQGHNRAPHPITCDACNRYPFMGTRWKCAECFDFDLCDACYRDDNSHLSHPFIRIDSPGSNGVLVKKRSEISTRSNVPREAEGGCRNQSAIGTTHPGVGCDTCGQWPLVGTRWKCTECFDFDLCSNCYKAGSHNMSHVFMMFEIAGSKGLMVKTECVTSEQSSSRPQQYSSQNINRHPGVYCDTCKQEPLVGTRWKCTECFDFDLCDNCYKAGSHDRSHPFIMFEKAGSFGIRVNNQSVKAEASKGMLEQTNRQNEPKDTSNNVGTDRQLETKLTEMEKRMQEMEESVNCSICMERPRNVAFMCGHTACRQCAECLNKCHMCRGQITRKINLYN